MGIDLTADDLAECYVTLLNSPLPFGLTCSCAGVVVCDATFTYTFSVQAAPNLRSTWCECGARVRRSSSAHPDRGCHRCA